MERSPSVEMQEYQKTKQQDQKTKQQDQKTKKHDQKTHERANDANEMKSGTLVELHSLQSAKQHNGKTGTLLNYNKESERWEVKLASGVVKVKNANLSPVTVNGGGDDGIDERDDAPPLWYDENLDEEFLDSWIFDPTFSEFLQAVDESDVTATIYI